MDALINSVQTANLVLQKSDPIRVAISAEGTVTSGGWSNGKLVPHMYVVPPKDGVQDFSFIATGPSGPATQGLVDKFPGEGWMPLLPWLKGVRIHTVTNSVEVMLTGASEGSDSMKLFSDDYWPFPL